MLALEIACVAAPPELETSEERLLYREEVVVVNCRRLMSAARAEDRVRESVMQHLVLLAGSAVDDAVRASAQMLAMVLPMLSWTNRS